MRCWKRRELGVEGAHEDNVAELLGWRGAGFDIHWTQQKPNRNRNGLEVRYGDLPVCAFILAPIQTRERSAEFLPVVPLVP